jgi:hypothetical protein
MWAEFWTLEGAEVKQYHRLFVIGKDTMRLSGYLFAEGGDRFIIICVHPKYGIQAGASQRVVNMLVGSDELEFASAILRRNAESNENAESPAVDVIYSMQVDNNLGGSCQ